MDRERAEVAVVRDYDAVLHDGHAQEFHVGHALATPFNRIEDIEPDPAQVCHNIGVDSRRSASRSPGASIGNLSRQQDFVADRGRGVTECLIEIGRRQLRVLAENIVAGGARRDPLQDDFHADARAAHNGFAAENGRIRSDALEHDTILIRNP
jgi:hypothetical protein